VNDESLQAGLWLVYVTLDDMSGVTIAEIADDGSVRVLGPERGVYLFPTRGGLADFLASGEWHCLQGRLDGVDLAAEEPQVDADFVYLRDRQNLAPHVAAKLWRNCLLLVDGCGIEAPETVEDATAQVAALTKLRDDFEQPGYAETDYWIGRHVQPVRLTVPSGTGVTLVAPKGFWDTDPEAQAFLGNFCRVVLFHNVAALEQYVRAPGTDQMREASWWPADAPDFEPRRTVDLRLADPHDPDADAFEYLRGLLMLLPGPPYTYKVHTMGALRVSRMARRIPKMLAHVDNLITWH
jgi:hypothetical protein